jgi:hypothetical protein
MVRGDVIRHIQFKTGTSERPSDVSVACILGTKLSGCVVWIGISTELHLKSFYWFGSGPSKRLPNILKYEQPRRTTHNKAGERPLRVNHRLVPKERFKKVKDLDALLERLIGPLDSAEG